MLVRFVEQNGSETVRDIPHTGSKYWCVPVHVKQSGHVDDVRFFQVDGEHPPTEYNTVYYNRRVTRDEFGDVVDIWFEYDVERNAPTQHPSGAGHGA